MGLWFVLFFWSLNSRAFSPETTTAVINNGFDIIHYDARLTPDLLEQTVSGRVRVTAKKLTGEQRPLVLSAKDKKILKVSAKNRQLRYRVAEEDLVIDFLPPLKAGQTFSLEIEYHSAPKRGVRFYPDHMFTVYHTGNWLVSHRSIADKAAFDLTLIHDAKLTTIGNGRLVSQTLAPSGKMHSHWQQQTPQPWYTLGFALGDFQQQSMAYQQQALNFFYRREAVSGLNGQQVRNIFSDVPDMVRFFEEKSGMALPNQGYSYVVVPGTIAQEADGFSLVGEKFAHTVIKEPGENWFIAHELAHEWWGNSITCAGFSHFWLNEGLVQFMVAAYQQQLFGEQAYHREIKLALARVHTGRCGKGVTAPLAFEREIAEQEINHTIVYNKGALVFYLLREKLGRKKLLAGIKGLQPGFCR